MVSYTDPAPGTYYYVVTAHFAAGEKAPSNQTQATTGVQLHTSLKFDDAD